MIRQYALAVSYSDGSGILRTFGPYATEATATAAEPSLRELYQPDSFGKWEVVPMYSVTITPAAEHTTPKGTEPAAVDLTISTELLEAIGPERFAQQLQQFFNATVISTRPGDDLGVRTVYALGIPGAPEGAVRAEPIFGVLSNDPVPRRLTQLDWYDAAGRFIRAERPGG